MGVRVDVCLYVSIGSISKGHQIIVPNISSSGLYGIESDSDQSHFEDVAREQYEELKEILAALGITDVQPLSEADWVQL